MKKLLLAVICSIFLLQGCSTSVDNLAVDQEEFSGMNFPKSSEIFGKLVAENIRQSVENINKKGLNYRNADNSEKFKKRFFQDFSTVNSKVLNKRSSNNVNKRETVNFEMSPEQKISKFNNLTEKQKDLVTKIIQECETSKSKNDLQKKIINLNKEIKDQLPEIQQERLYNVTACLYFGISEIYALEKNGQLIEIKGETSSFPRLKASGEDPSWGSSCRKFLATGWTIALGEPTPAGEIVMSVSTVIVAGVLMYEIVTCKSSTPVHPNPSENICGKNYADCTIKNSSWLCYACFQQCQGQGVWNCPGERK